MTAPAASVPSVPPTPKPISENPLVVRLRNELLKRGGSGIKGISFFKRKLLTN